jgi:hypothetical protein
MPAPCTACRTHERGGSSPTCAGDGRASEASPSHTRYSAPAAVRTVSARGERATTAAIPAATTAVAARCLWGSRSRPDLVTSNDWPCPAAKQDHGTCRYACST